MSVISPSHFDSICLYVSFTCTCISKGAGVQTVIYIRVQRKAVQGICTLSMEILYFDLQEGLLKESLMCSVRVCVKYIFSKEKQVVIELPWVSDPGHVIWSWLSSQKNLELSGAMPIMWLEDELKCHSYNSLGEWEMWLCISLIAAFFSRNIILLSFSKLGCCI